MSLKLSYLLPYLLSFDSSNDKKHYFNRLTEKIISLSWDRPCDKDIDPPTCADCPELIDYICKYKRIKLDSQMQRFVPLPQYDLLDLHVLLVDYALEVEDVQTRAALLDNLASLDWFSGVGFCMADAESRGIMPRNILDVLMYEDVVCHIRCWAEEHGIRYDDDSKVIAGMSKAALGVFNARRMLNSLCAVSKAFLKLYKKNTQRNLSRTASPV